MTRRYSDYSFRVSRTGTADQAAMPTQSYGNFGLARPATRPGMPGRRATHRAERPDLHAPADERNGPHDRA